MDDDGHMDIVRKGDVNLMTSYNIVWTLKGVRHMPELI